MNQEDRDLILYDIECKKIDNKDLYLYDLTSYYEFEDGLNETLFDKKLKLDLQLLRMIHNPKISFTPQQYDMFHQISRKGKYAVSATTSFGKTTVIKEYIKRNNPKNVVYVVPTNSLADELLEDFSNIFDDYNIIDTSVKNKKEANDNKIIFVGTQEKLNEIKWFKDIDIELFVIDEAYKLTDVISGYREVSLNRVFIDYINRAKTTVLLLPLVNNIEGLEKFGIKILKYDYSPVAKKFIKIKSEEFEKEIINKINENKEKTLVYFESPSELEEFFWNNEKKIEKNMIESDSWIKRVENDFHPEWFPILAYKRGICVHYGAIPKFIQVMMTKKFNKDQNFNTMLSTSSLIEGVNTPTKNIYINDKKILSKSKQIKFKNLIGRAGRLNITPVGYIYYNEKNEKDFNIANEDWKKINLKIILEDEEKIDDINRGTLSLELEELSKKYKINIEDFKQFIEESGISISKLDKFIEKIKKFNEYFREKEWSLDNTTGLVTFYTKCNIGPSSLHKMNVKVKPENELKIIKNTNKDNLMKDVAYEYYKKLFSVTINKNVGLQNTITVKNMVTYIIEHINLEEYNMNISMIVSSVIKMVYNFLPYELIPLIENIIMLNELFKQNNQLLLDDTIINKLQIQLNKYNLKYYGTYDSNEKDKKIIKRMFEYGIPFNIVSQDINYISSKLNDSFSIIDIKRIIYNNQELLWKYKNYFE